MAMFEPRSVGMPGIIVLAVGGAIFAAALLWTRVARPREGSTATRRSGLSTLGILLQMVAFVLVSIGGFRATLPATNPAAVAVAIGVAILMLVATGLFVAAARAMGANWSVVARMREDHELVTRGVFAYLRHPIYTGMVASLVAVALAFGHLANLVVGVPLFFAGTWIRIREEEALLKAEFGAAYDAYAARVKRFLPGLF